MMRSGLGWTVGLLAACGTATVEVETTPAVVEAQEPAVVPSTDSGRPEDTGRDEGSDPVPERREGEDTTLEVFAAEHVFFGSENRRSVDVEVALPEADQTFSAITGRFKLHCPSGRCDHWDRYGTFGIVMNPGTDAAEYVELDRFITAYRTGHEWTADLTDLRPVLTGTVTLRVHIDTWVGPGHDQGDGWLFDAELDYVGGPPPSPEAVEVIPVWSHHRFDYGLPSRTVSSQVPPVQIETLPGSRFVMRSFISGHGFGGRDNCAEFCPRQHGYDVGDVSIRRTVWRDDCHTTITDGPQYGTWQYARAGWCPGAQVHVWEEDVTPAFQGTEPVTVSYGVADYTWDSQGGQPYYYMSGVLVRFE